MLPDFDENGNLPPGDYMVSLDDIAKRFNVHSWRTRGPLTTALQDYIASLKIYAAHILLVYIDGSYTTEKLAPSDVDITIVFAADYDLAAEAWRYKNRTWVKRKLDIHLYKEDYAGLTSHITDWKTDREKQVPKGIILLERTL